MAQALQVGVGRRDITPPVGTLLMGYPDPHGHRAADRVRDPLHATALAFEQDGRRAAWVSVDVALLEDVHVQQVRERISERTGIEPGHVTVCAIQTHSAPRTQHVWGWCILDHEYIDNIMVPGIVEAIVEADGKRSPARVGIATTESRVGVNRRQVLDNHGIGLGQNQWDVFDPTMTVLRFDNADGVLANVVHYGAHPTVFGGWSKVISRDWPGVMIDRVEQLTGAPTLFINGAVGDIAPRTNSMSATGDSEAALLEAGYDAALDAMRPGRSIRDMRDLSLHVATGVYELPYRPLPPVAEAKAQVRQWEPRKNEPGAGMAEYMHWSAVIEAHGKPAKTGKPYAQVVTALGPVSLVPMPGEPFGSTVMRMRERSPFQHTLCASTSCGNNGYFHTRESIHRGGYEVWVGKALGAYLLADGVDDVLIDENLKLLREAFDRVYPALA